MGAASLVGFKGAGFDFFFVDLATAGSRVPQSLRGWFMPLRPIPMNSRDERWVLGHPTSPLTLPDY